MQQEQSFSRDSNKSDLNLKGTPGYRIKLILNNMHQNEIDTGGIQKFVAKSGILNFPGQFCAYLSFGTRYFSIEYSI